MVIFLHSCLICDVLCINQHHETPHKWRVSLCWVSLLKLVFSCLWVNMCTSKASLSIMTLRISVECHCPEGHGTIEESVECKIVGRRQYENGKESQSTFHSCMINGTHFFEMPWHYLRSYMYIFKHTHAQRERERKREREREKDRTEVFYCFKNFFFSYLVLNTKSFFFIFCWKSWKTFFLSQCYKTFQCL